MPPIRNVGRNKTSAEPDKSQRQQSAGVPGGVGICGHVDRADAGKPRKRNCGSRGNAEFQPSVDRDGPRPALAPPADPRAARGQPRHEDGEDGGDRVRRVAKNQSERLAPHHLIDQSGRAREEKTGQQRGEQITARSEWGLYALILMQEGNSAGRLSRHGGANGSLGIS